jgi:hypothetical protein
MKNVISKFLNMNLVVDYSKNQIYIKIDIQVGIGYF